MKRFVKYAWFLTGYNVLVIVWGAVVRATGSGAGCGNHWPKCNGEVIPAPERIETIIEFTHRLSSALDGLLVLILLIWAWRITQKGSALRRWAWIVFVLIIVEGWLGMLLVRLDLVADNASVLRAVMVAVHLTNTYLLIGSMAVTAWLAATGVERRWRKPSRETWLVVGGLLLGVLISAAGAVTALGDTLFPAESLAAGLRADLDATASFLVQLRVIHPLLAVGTAVYLFWVGSRLRTIPSPHIIKMVDRLYTVMGLQVLGGFINVLLLAPIWMQVIHLALADAFWLVLVVLSVETFSEAA